MEYVFIWIGIAVGVFVIFISKKILFDQVKEACLLVLLDHPRFLDEISAEITRRSKGKDKYHNKVITAALEELIQDDFVSKSEALHPKSKKLDWKYRFKNKPPRKNKFSEWSMFRKKLDLGVNAMIRAP